MKMCGSNVWQRRAVPSEPPTAWCNGELVVAVTLHMPEPPLNFAAGSAVCRLQRMLTSWSGGSTC